MQWTTGKHAGFSDFQPWLPVNEDYPVLNVETQENDVTSLFHFYKTLIGLRKKHKALNKGDWKPLIKGKNGIFAYRREFQKEKIVVLLNFSGKKRKIGLNETSIGKIIVSTHHPSDAEFNPFVMMAEPFEATLVEISPCPLSRVY